MGVQKKNGLGGEVKTVMKWKGVSFESNKGIKSFQEWVGVPKSAGGLKKSKFSESLQIFIETW